MAFPFSDALPYLRGIDELDENDPHGVDGAALVAWLSSRAIEVTETVFFDRMKTLKNDGFVTYQSKFPDETQVGSSAFGIKLDTLGRNAVAGWPSAGTIDRETLTNAVLAALSAEAENPDTPEEVKGFLRKLGEGAATTVLTTALTAGMAAAGLS